MSTDNQYADRDAMWLDQQGGHYIRHVDHMTREGLHSKSDIAAELGWRDLQIQELTQQLSAKIISEQNIINAFGISGEGAHSKLVIEYVHGLVAESEAMKDINAWCRTDAFQNMYREFKIAEAAGCDVIDCMHDAMLTAIMHAPATPKTDVFTAELRAQGVDEFAENMQSEKPFWEPEDWAMMDLAAEEAHKFAANLRAGRKG